MIRIFLPEHGMDKNASEDIGNKTMGIGHVDQVRIVIFSEFGGRIYFLDSDEK